MEGEHAAYVLRLLRNEDVSADLREKSLYCLWTDYGNTWYRSVVEKCDPASGTASLCVLLSECVHARVPGCPGVGCAVLLHRVVVLGGNSVSSLSAIVCLRALASHPLLSISNGHRYYEGTQEREEASLFTLIRDGEVAFKEVRRGAEYVPVAGEILVTDDVKIDECEKGGSGESSSEGDEDEDDELSMARRKRRLNARRVYDTYMDEGLFDDVGDDDDYDLDGDAENTATTARRAKLGESKAGAVRELAAKRKRQQLVERKKKREEVQKKTVEEDVRNKVRGYFEKSLRTPTKGLESVDDAELDHAGVAEMVESALYRLHGEVNQGYKQKASTLKFNLSGNEELRLHVLTGDIPASRLVEMDSTALASRELLEYRKKKEEEALKMSVLDTETAAKFSTAAALESAYSGYTGVKEVSGKLTSPTPGRVVDGTNGAAEKKLEEVDTQGSVRALSSLDWKSIKSAQVSMAGSEPNVISGLQEIEVGGEEEEEEGGAAGAVGAVGAAGGKERHNPSDPPSGQPDGHPHVVCDENLRKLLMPSADVRSLGENVWEGTVAVQSVGGSMMVASGLAGAGDLSDLLGGPKIEVPGRLALDKLGDFLERLRVSTSRTATVGVLSPSKSRPTSTNVVDSTKLVSYYKGRDRAGSFKRTSQIEIFLIPSGNLASRILNTCWHAGNRATIEACVGSPPLELGPGQLVFVVVHPKDMVAQPKAVPMVPMVPAAVPETVPATALPGSLDLGAISNLAAALGVAVDSSGSNPAVPVPPPPPAANLPPSLDLGALNSLAAAFGVAPTTSPPPPRNPGGRSGRPQYSRRR